MSFAGEWDVISSQDFDDDYLQLDGPSFVRLRQKGGRVEGEYHIGVQDGSLDGRLQGGDRLLLSFDGVDEMDPVNGAGLAVLKGDELTLTLMYHLGDDFTYECRRRGQR